MEDAASAVMQGHFRSQSAPFSVGIVRFATRVDDFSGETARMDRPEPQLPAELQQRRQNLHKARLALAAGNTNQARQILAADARLRGMALARQRERNERA